MATRKGKNNSLINKIIILIIFFVIIYFKNDFERFLASKFINSYALSDIPEYTNEKYIFINNNIPEFSESDITTDSYEHYSELDILGRAGVAIANIGIDLMPTKERERIGMIKPSGWQTTKYDFVDNKYLYNRCHLIAYQLTGENANPKNLITCTRNMNAKVMVEWENKVANYIKKTGNHVLYRVTPIFKSNNMLATGVEIEAMSVEDKGRDIKFNVFIYNVEDGVEINYLDGTSKLAN
ncbi:MAG: DNA/RNA non-specific endonuclease [Bacilli bacterium]|nr:DNA/RNA non-specific endonuclease [Bacilli bacterium]